MERMKILHGTDPSSHTNTRTRYISRTFCTAFEWLWPLQKSLAIAIDRSSIGSESSDCPRTIYGPSDTAWFDGQREFLPRTGSSRGQTHSDGSLGKQWCCSEYRYVWDLRCWGLIHFHPWASSAKLAKMMMNDEVSLRDFVTGDLVVVLSFRLLVVIDGVNVYVRLVYSRLRWFAFRKV